MYWSPHSPQKWVLSLLKFMGIKWNLFGTLIGDFITTWGTLYFSVCCPFRMCLWSVVFNFPLTIKKKLDCLFLSSCKVKKTTPLLGLLSCWVCIFCVSVLYRALKNQVHIEKGTNALFIDLIQLIELIVNRVNSGELCYFAYHEDTMDKYPGQEKATF